MLINIASINVNGLCTENKQKLLHAFIIQHKLDIVYIQEHNIREDGKIAFLEMFYEVIMNKSVNMKGGTCILIKKSLTYKVERIEMSADSRLISVICSLQNKKIHLLNIYAQSGNNFYAAREDFFDQELPYYLRHHTSNIFLGGDFNSVLSLNDVSNNSPTLLSKTLLKLVRQAKIVDAWFIHNNRTQYTYVRQNYGSRIDRFYINNKDNIRSSKVIHCSFSDHSAVVINVNK